MAARGFTLRDDSVRYAENQSICIRVDDPRSSQLTYSGGGGWRLKGYFAVDGIVAVKQGITERAIVPIPIEHAVGEPGRSIGRCKTLRRCLATLRMSRPRVYRRPLGFDGSGGFSRASLSGTAPDPQDAGGAPAQLLRPIASFGFSMRMTPEEAVARLAAVLDEVDPEWRSFVQVWDGLRGGIANAVQVPGRRGSVGGCTSSTGSLVRSM